MPRTLQNILRTNHRKVHYRPRKAALLMTLANEDKKAVAKLIRKWLKDELKQEQKQEQKHAQ